MTRAPWPTVLLFAATDPHDVAIGLERGFGMWQMSWPFADSARDGSPSPGGKMHGRLLTLGRERKGAFGQRQGAIKRDCDILGISARFVASETRKRAAMKPRSEPDHTDASRFSIRFSYERSLRYALNSTMLHVTKGAYAVAASPSKTTRERVSEHRRRLRRQGLRPIQIWVPDVHSPSFKLEARRQSLAVAASAHAGEDQAFIDALSVMALDDGANE